MINPHLEFRFKREQLKRGTDGALLMTWQVPVDLTYFDGHFPQNPVFPAVGIIDASLEVIQLSLESGPVALEEVTAGKFFRPVTPSMNVEISFVPKENGRWKIQWKSDDKLLVDLDLRLGREIAN